AQRTARQRPAGIGAALRMKLETTWRFAFETLPRGSPFGRYQSTRSAVYGACGCCSNWKFAQAIVVPAGKCGVVRPARVALVYERLTTPSCGPRIGIVRTCIGT